MNELQPDGSLVEVSPSMKWRQDHKRAETRARARSAESPPKNAPPPPSVPRPVPRFAARYSRASEIVPPTPPAV